MVGGSVAKLLQAAGEVKEVLVKIGQDLPGGVSAKALDDRTHFLKSTVSALDALNAEKTRLVNEKKAACHQLSDFIVKSRLAIKVQFGPDSSEYDMAGGTKTSERKKPVRKPKQKG